MLVKRRQLSVSSAVLASLIVTAAPAATAADTPPAREITGIVQTIIREQPRGHHPDAHDTSKVIRVGTTFVPLTDGSLPTAQDGSTVALTVTAAPAGANDVMSATTISPPVAAAISPVHQVYVALVLPVGVAADATVTDASARAMVSTVSQYWSSQTGAKVSFGTAQVLAYQSAFSCGATSSMWTEALNKMPAASGAGRHLVVVAPGGADKLGCDYGLGSIGAVEASRNEVFVSGLDQSLLAHELGHNLGLEHSNALRCGTVQDLATSGTTFPGCTARPYDDLFDVMGYSGTSFGEGNLNAVHLDGMNLLPNAVRKIAANSGVTATRLTPLSTTTDSRTLKVTDPNGSHYFVEYRTNSGRDAVAARNPYRPSWGVRVLREDPEAAASAGSYELDATPTSDTNDYNRSIPVGGTFTAASGRVTIKVTAADASAASVTVTDGTSLTPPVVPPAPPAPPTSAAPSRVTMSIPTSASVGSRITAATRVTNLQGGGVAGWVVTLQKMQKGTTAWRSLRSLTTTSTGSASYAFSNGVSGSYRWVTSAATGAPSKVSPSVAVTSRAQVSGSRPAATLPSGTPLTINGTISSVAAPVVYIQYRHADTPWRTGPRATVTGNAVSGSIVLYTKTTAYTRLYVSPAATYLGSVSGSYPTEVG